MKCLSCSEKHSCDGMSGTYLLPYCIYCVVDVNVTGNEVATQWYDEVKNYDFRRHCGANTGLFMSNANTDRQQC